METKNNLTPPGSQTKKATVLAIISAIVLVLAVASSALAAHFWQQERMSADSLRDRVSELESGTPSTETPSESAGRICENSTARFTANVGKFALSLEDKSYVIIKNHDGAGEGGDSSLISVGKCLDGENNVVNYATNEEVTISAIPASNGEGTNFSDWVTSRVEADGGESRELDGTTVADIEAREFSITGLGETRKIFFENNGIWYEVTAYNAEGNALSIRSDTLEGFSFTD